MSSPAQLHTVRISATFPTPGGSHTCITITGTLAGPQAEAHKLTALIQDWIQDNVRRNGPYWTIQQERDFLDSLNKSGITLHNPQGPAYIATESDGRVIAEQYWLNGVRQNPMAPGP